MRELNTVSSIDSIEAVTAFVDSQLEEAECPVKAQMQIDIAIDELFSNISKFAYNPELGPVTIKVEFTSDKDSVSITFMDKGRPYDPTKAEDPDITLSAEERGIGGLGIFMVKKTMDDVSYEYKDGCNILTITKRI